MNKKIWEYISEDKHITDSYILLRFINPPDGGLYLEGKKKSKHEQTTNSIGRNELTLPEGLFLLDFQKCTQEGTIQCKIIIGEIEVYDTMVNLAEISTISPYKLPQEKIERMIGSDNKKRQLSLMIGTDTVELVPPIPNKKTVDRKNKNKGDGGRGSVGIELLQLDLKFGVELKLDRLNFRRSEVAEKRVDILKWGKDVMKLLTEIKNAKKVFEPGYVKEIARFADEGHRLLLTINERDLASKMVECCCYIQKLKKKDFDELSRCKILLASGKMKRNQDFWDEAQTCLEEAKEIMYNLIVKSTNETTASDNARVFADVCNTLGNVYLAKGIREKAKECYQQGLSYITIASREKGNLHLSLARFLIKEREGYLEHHKLAVESFTKQNYDLGLFSTELFEIDILIKQGEFQESLKKLGDLHVKWNKNDWDIVLLTWREVKIYLRKKELKEMEKKLREITKLLQKMNSDDQTLFVLEGKVTFLRSLLKRDKQSRINLEKEAKEKMERGGIEDPTKKFSQLERKFKM